MTAPLTCSACATENEADARFCDGCGATLARSCPSCGVEARATARFCRACGAPLDASPSTSSDLGPARKTVTVLFADLAGSTSFEERVDAETARDVMSRYHDLLRGTAERHRAGLTKYIGDGFMAVWGVPEMGPDDADHAIGAAVELQDRFVGFAGRVTASHGVDLALRVAVNTGEVVVGAGDADLVGDAVNVAARLEAECPHGHVVVGEETWRTTRGTHRYESHGQVRVKGRSAPVAVYQWLARSETAQATPFVGRAAELRRLNDALKATTAARLVTLIGDPGVGKSRLADEFVAGHDGPVLRARCTFESTVALAPIVELLRARDLDGDVDSEVPERDRLLRDLMGLTAGVPGSVEETFWALRRYVEVLAGDGPLVLVIDDVHWADSLLLDFIEHLVEWVKDVPVLVVALARPELRELRPDLALAGRWVTDAIHLRGLDPVATAELATRVLGAARLPGELLERLPASTGGNPLFVRELVGMLVHDGVLVTEPVGWRLTIDVDAIAIPPTIHALLASRLERLDAMDRRMLEIASVIGTDFSLGSVAALARTRSGELKGSFDRLRHMELTAPSGAYDGDEPVWRFHHVLIRDVAYRRLLKSDRAELHERLADWVRERGADVAFDADELAARHLEAAHGYRSELGGTDAHTAELAMTAARSYLASAQRALDRDELISAGTQAAKGAALAHGDNDVRADLLLVGCEAFLSAGDVAAGAPLVDDLERLGTAELQPWATCYRCQFVVYTDPTRLIEVEDRLQGAIDEFARRRDAAGLAKAHRVRAGTRARLGRVGDCEVDLFEALIAAREAGDHRQITAALGAAPSAALWGPSPLPKAGGRCLDVVRMQRMTTAAPSLEATSLRCLAVLELLRGRPDKARSMLAEARDVVAKLGLRHGLMETELFASIIESMEGDPVAAEPHFRAALEGLGALGVGADAGLAAALLARSLLAQDRIGEADHYAAESERLAGHNLKTAIGWRAVRAEILAAQGKHADATAVARDAVRLAAETDLVLDHADASLALARVLDASDDRAGAESARRAAAALYAAKETASSIAVAPPPTAASSSATLRLLITNEANEAVESGWRAMQDGDLETVVARYAEGFTYDDRRRLTGDPITNHAEMRAAFERIFAQFTTFEYQPLAVRGEHLVLSWSRWSDGSGNATAGPFVFETDADGLTAYAARFDEDDFDDAYRELERRYYAGEGAQFAANGRVKAAFLDAMNELDGDAAARLVQNDFRWLAPASTLAERERSVSEAFSWFTARAEQVSSVRSWFSVVHWLSPTSSVSRGEVRAVGSAGEDYQWTRIYVDEFRAGRLLWIREHDDESSAFGYGSSITRPHTRLEVRNQASDSVESAWQELRNHDVDAVVARYADHFVYDDRRQIGGEPITDRAGIRAAFMRVFAQFNHFEQRTLAVRGERLVLIWSRWSDDSGNETTGLFVFEGDDHGRTTYAGRFEIDDFAAACRELDRRYYAGEGAEFAAGARVVTDFIVAMDRLDVAAARTLTSPGFRYEGTPSTLTLQGGSVDDMFDALTQRARQVASTQSGFAVVRWLTPTCLVGRGVVRAIGLADEPVEWSGCYVVELRDGRLSSLRQFDDEDDAFTDAETRAAPTLPRLSVDNVASRTHTGIMNALQRREVNHALGWWAADFTYVDRRRLPSGGIVGRDQLAVNLDLVSTQFAHFDRQTLAVRGERLQLSSSRWSDGAGNESRYLHLVEVDAEGRISHQSVFDEDDFASAYRALERRYAADEGSAFVDNIEVTTEFLAAIDRLDVDTARSLTVPEFRWLAPPSTLAREERTIDEMFTWFSDRVSQVGGVRNWISTVQWLSPTCLVALGEAAVFGAGHEFGWSRVYVDEFRDGRMVQVHQFDDEAAAFAYAEQRASRPRLAVCNRASELNVGLNDAMQRLDAEASAAFFAVKFTYDDRRQLSGEPIADRASLQAAITRVHEQFTRFDMQSLAVRGERLTLLRQCWSGDSGYETTSLYVFELGDDELYCYMGRFDEDDFEGAYRELEQRYYAGEGARFARYGLAGCEWLLAVNRNDLEVLGASDVHYYDRSRSLFGDRSTSQYRTSLEHLASMVASSRSWLSAIHWMSPTVSVARFQRDAVGADGTDYRWTMLIVSEFRDGRTSAAHQFEHDDEAEAFAFAKRLTQSTRLAMSNRAAEVDAKITHIAVARDFDSLTRFYAEGFDYDDHRRLRGDPVVGHTALRAAIERLANHYTIFEVRTLAVRGDRLQLAHVRWADDAGNQSFHFRVFEFQDDEVIYQGVFDDDDFDGAYRTLEQRYYAGEGAPFAESGMTACEWFLALNRNDLDAVFGAHSLQVLRYHDHSRSMFGDRSAEQFRASLEQLIPMVTSSRSWLPAIQWLSPTSCVTRFERTAVGLDGEGYRWAWVFYTEFENGLMAQVHQFEVDDEAAAFAYAQELGAATPLAVENQAARAARGVAMALQDKDADAAAAAYAETLTYDDRRRFGGAPVRGRGEIRAAFERLCGQFDVYETTTITVRGDRLCLGEGRWSDHSGNRTTLLHLVELGSDGLIRHQSPFELDDFDAAMTELERRYHADEGAPYAEPGATLSAVMTAMNDGQLERLFREYMTPDLRIENRSRSAFPDRSAAELRASVAELNGMMSSIRAWNSALQWVSPRAVVMRMEREATGPDGEPYAWNRLLVAEFHAGLISALCEFDIDDAEQAVGYARQRSVRE